MGLLSKILEEEPLAFHNSKIPALEVGEGRLFSLAETLRQQGFTTVSLVTGGASYATAGYREAFEKSLRSAGIKFEHYPVSGEPSPDKVDSLTAATARENSQAILAVGGGSVMDTGKAVAAMRKQEGGVKEYLEGVGNKKLRPERLPLIMVPSTAGTGSEGTSNAVLSEVGEGGFKKSLRNDALVPDLAILDPLVTVSCPRDVTAAAGMDALTQLLEAYVSEKSSPFTDLLALEGLRRIGRALPQVVRHGEDVKMRLQVSYAAYLSGVVLSNAGLGVVHGAASPLGAKRHIPHGVVCGTLLPAATKVIVQALEKQAEKGRPALQKFSNAAMVLTEEDGGTPEENVRNLIDLLYHWAEEFDLPRLGAYGFTSDDVKEVAEKSPLKGTPADLSVQEIRSILEERL